MWALVNGSGNRSIPCVAAANKIRFVDHRDTLNSALHERFLLLCTLPLLPSPLFVTLMPLESTPF